MTDWWLIAVGAVALGITALVLVALGVALERSHHWKEDPLEVIEPEYGQDPMDAVQWGEDHVDHAA